MDRMNRTDRTDAGAYLGAYPGAYRGLWRDTAERSGERRRMIAVLYRTQGVHRRRDAFRRRILRRGRIPAGITAAGLAAKIAGTAVLALTGA